MSVIDHAQLHGTLFLDIIPLFIGHQYKSDDLPLLATSSNGLEQIVLLVYFSLFI